MFEQTFLDETKKTAKPLSLLFSTLIQIGVLGILLLIPLIYTATLPDPLFRSLLVAPRPPMASIPNHLSAKTKAGRIVRVFSGRTLFAPRAVPQHVTPSSDLGPAPDVPVGAANGQDAANASLPGDLLGTGPAPVPLVEQPQPKPVPRAVRVGGGVAEANLLNKVVPPYPALAKAARIQGTVEFSATINKDGNIENLQLLHGHPLLVKAAREAVLQWKYRPTLLNGEPVEVLTEIVVHFTLAQ